MRRLWWISIAVVALLVPVVVLAGSGESEFDSVVHSIESKYHVRANRIPFLGVVSMISEKRPRAVSAVCTSRILSPSLGRWTVRN
jgi:hypothetical protein